LVEERDWLRVKSYITPGIGVPEVNVSRGNGMVVYFVNVNKVQYVNGGQVGSKNAARVVENMSRRAVMTSHMRNGVPYDFIVSADAASKSAELFTTINWIKQYPIAPIDCSGSNVHCAPTRMAHVLIVASKNSSWTEVYSVLGDLCDSLRLTPDKVYVSGELATGSSVGEAWFDKYRMFQAKMKEDEL